MSRLVGYTADQIPYVWPKVEGYIQAGLERGSNYTIDEVLERLCDKRMQLWASQGDGIEAAMVTAIETSRDGVTYCLMLSAGGTNMQEWVAFLPLVEDWARENGATEMRVYGRRGWAKALGYDIRYTALGKKL